MDCQSTKEQQSDQIPMRLHKIRYSTCTVLLNQAETETSSTEYLAKMCCDIHNNTKVCRALDLVAGS